MVHHTITRVIPCKQEVKTMLGKNSNMGKRARMCHTSTKNVEASTEAKACGGKSCKGGRSSVKNCK